jgi:hypothetical protein
VVDPVTFLIFGPVVAVVALLLGPFLFIPVGMHFVGTARDSNFRGEYALRMVIGVIVLGAWSVLVLAYVVPWIVIVLKMVL